MSNWIYYARYLIRDNNDRISYTQLRLPNIEVAIGNAPSLVSALSDGALIGVIIRAVSDITVGTNPYSFWAWRYPVWAVGNPPISEYRALQLPVAGAFSLEVIYDYGQIEVDLLNEIAAIIWPGETLTLLGY